MKFNSLLIIILLASLPVFSQSYRVASPDYTLSFPKDHFPHSGFRTEWWYYTGHIDDNTGDKFGFQFTIFKVEPGPPGVPNRPPVLYLLHSAVTDLTGKTFLFSEILQREFPGTAGFNPADSSLNVEGSKLKITENRHILSSSSSDFSFSFDLKSALLPVLHGKGGYSPKSNEPGNASHYYSVVGLQGTGTLTINKKQVPVKSVSAWMDHEFSSNALSPFQSGWDWVTLSLDNGWKVMAFQVRGNPQFVSGSLISPDGKLTELDQKTISFHPGRTWTSEKSKGVYPVEWEIKSGENKFKISPWIDNQELVMKETGVTYWEGAISVKGELNGKPVTGKGYLEMTGYAGKMNGKL